MCTVHKNAGLACVQSVRPLPLALSLVHVATSSDEVLPLLIRCCVPHLAICCTGSRLRDSASHGPLKVAEHIHSLPAPVPGMPQLPFLIVNPQCPHDLIWSQCAEDLHRIIHEVIRMHGNVDLDRIYLTGLSMGGMGCWTMALAFPDTFAAVAPICGAFIPPPQPEIAAERMQPGGFEKFGLRDHPTVKHAKTLQHLPFYIVHGAKDDAVPVAGSLEICARLEEVGALDVTLLVYPDVDGRVGHDSWSQTYENPEFYRWLLSKRNPRKLASL